MDGDGRKLRERLGSFRRDVYFSSREMEDEGRYLRTRTAEGLLCYFETD